MPCGHGNGLNPFYWKVVFIAIAIARYNFGVVFSRNSSLYFSVFDFGSLFREQSTHYITLGYCTVVQISS